MPTLTAVRKSLDIATFTRYFRSGKMGRLHFPNGNPHISDGRYWIHLSDLFKLMCGWRVDETEVPLDEILAIISFGSAVHYPGVRTFRKIRRRWLLFGEERLVEKSVRIIPRDADFLVVTRSAVSHEASIDTRVREWYDYTELKRGGIHLVSRGAQQLVEGVIEGHDTIGISALRHGVPVFTNDDAFLEDIHRRTGADCENPRKVAWDEDDDGRLNGWID